MTLRSWRVPSRQTAKEQCGISHGIDPQVDTAPFERMAFAGNQIFDRRDRAALAAGVDPDIAADWRQLNELRRQAFQALFARVPAGALRPGLGPAAAADTAWVIASPDTHDQLVRQAGYSYDQLENWARSTLSAALLAGPERE